MPLTPNILFAKWPMEDFLWNALCNGEYPFDTSKFSDPACSIYFLEYSDHTLYRQIRPMFIYYDRQGFEESHSSYTTSY